MKMRMLCLIAAAVMFGCTGKYVRPTTTEKVQITPERVKRGEYLVRTEAQCAACHDGRQSGNILDPATPELALAGGSFIQDGDIGVWVPDITNDTESGIGHWSDDEVMRAIRDGVRPDGSFLFPLMPYGSYQYMSDEDVRAVVAYLRTTPPLKPPQPQRKDDIPFIVRTALGTGMMMHKPAQNVPPPDTSDPVRYGEYVAHLGHCGDCHSMGKTRPRGPGDDFMAGSDRPMDLAGVGKVWAPNLTPDPDTGLGRYSVEQIRTALFSGHRLDGKLMAPPMSLYVPAFAVFEPKDMDALLAYLKSLPPVKKSVPERQLTDEYKRLLRE